MQKVYFRCNLCNLFGDSVGANNYSPGIYKRKVLTLWAGEVLKLVRSNRAKCA